MPREADGGDAVPVTWAQVHAFRMARHHLDRPVPRAQLVRAVGDAGGVQAQVMAAAQLAVRVRVRGAVVDDVERALWRDRSLARVWCLRGTIHLVPSAEAGAYVRGCASRQEARAWVWFVRKGATREAVDRLLAAGAAAMDRPRTRAEILQRIHEKLGWPIVHEGSRGWGSPVDVAGFRLGGVVVTAPDIAWLACFRGLACFGPDGGDGSTFVRPDAWLRGWRDVSVEDAEDALLRRHLGSFGPATVSDFAMWSILTMARAKQVWARLEGELCPVTVDGTTAWVLRGDLAALRRAKLPRTAVRLLPYFDSYLMGYKDRGHLVDAAHRKRIYRQAGWVYPAVLVDGRVAGEWGYERKGRRLRVRVQPYEPLAAAVQDLVRGEADDVARFLAAEDVRVTFAKPR